MLLCLKQWSNLERWMAAQQGDKLTSFVRVHQTLIRVWLEPADYRNAVIAVNHKRIMGVADHASQLQFHNLIENVYRFQLILVIHGTQSPLVADITLAD